MNPLQSFLTSGAIARTRRNHGLEHATISVLSRQYPQISMAGNSDSGGFWLFGDLPTEGVEAGVRTALSRLRAGEEKLALHPNCGTNYLVSGLIAGLAGVFAMTGAGPRLRDKLERLPLLTVFAGLALMFAQPFGFIVQERVTVSGKPAGLAVLSVQRFQRGRMTVHRISTES